MAEYIRREDLMERVGRWQLNTREAIAEMIMSVPSADVVSREDYEDLELVCKNYEEALKDAVDELEKKEVEERKKGEWDMFDLISSAYYGKGMYFKQDNGIVYSRHSGNYMTVDEAIREFISLIDEAKEGEI